MANLTIARMIMHDLNVSKDSPTHFDECIGLSSLSEDVLDFFAEHIDNVSKNRKIQSCRFTHENATVLADCIEIANDLDDTKVFVKNSQNMSTSLFNAMKSNSSISPGTLIFVQFFNKQTESHYLSIMKMDPNKAIQLDSENNTFKVQTDILPSAKENLHKCAIVKLDANLWTEGIHLRVLDKQQIKGEVSKFFLFTFLEAKKVVNDKSMTELVQNKLLEFALSEKYITVREMGDFSRKVDRILTSNRDVDLDRDLESLFSHYVEGDADTERAIGDFKVKLIDHDEHSYFKFRADNEKTKNLIISDVGKTLRIQFPIQYFGKEIIINDIDESTKGLLIDEISREEQGKVMIIRGLDLDQRVI